MGKNVIFFCSDLHHFLQLPPSCCFPPKRAVWIVRGWSVSTLPNVLCYDSLASSELSLDSDFTKKNFALFFLLGPAPHCHMWDCNQRKPLQGCFSGAFCIFHHCPYNFLESWLKRQIVLDKEIKPIDWNLQWGMNHYLISCWDHMLRMCRDLGIWRY